MILSNAGTLAIKAVKNGWAKASEIKDTMKSFSDKNKEDDTGIDWDKIEIDDAGFKMKCLFDGDSGKQLKEFVKKLSAEMKKYGKKEKKLEEAKMLNEAEMPKISQEALTAIIKAA